ncbi:conserved hypothetical protein [Vibrio phage 242E40-1]|nr:conserved hypothetical protein [Vibrio phage 242E40-1]
MNSNIIKALGDNAKFYPNYLTNHVASDFKFHLDNGIGKLMSEKDRLQQENAELREHLANLVTESIALAQFKNDTLRKGICSTDMDEPEWHDYQTIGEAGAYLENLLNKND